MAARLARLLVALGLLLGGVLPSPAAAAVVRLPTSQKTDASPVPARGVDPAYARSYFGARYYRSDLGRFTTIDPVYTWKENLEDPQRWNRYAYARNNPLKYTDPDGKVPILAIVAIAWGAYEIGSQIYDAYTAYRTVTDPNATGREKLAAVGGFALGAVAPGGGYGTAAKTAVGKLDDAVAVAQEVSRVGTRLNNLKHATNIEHYVAAAGDLLGQPIVKGGRTFDHLSEVRNAQRGLVSLIERIKGDLGTLELSKQQRAELQRRLSQASKLLDESERYIPR